MSIGIVLAAASAVMCVEPEEPAIGSLTEELGATGPAGAVATVPIPRRSFWTYDATGVDQGSSWRVYSGPNSWPIGWGPFGYGESYLSTIVSDGGNPTARNPTTYFRRTFAIGDVSKLRKLYLRVMYDDGFVFYLNGAEGGRASMPTGPISYGSRAVGHEAGGYVTFDISAQIPHLRSYADNFIGVEVHQATAASSDLVFDAELIAWSDPPYSIGVPSQLERGARWQFWDRSTAPATTWTAPTYDATAWSSGAGPFGFGEQYVVTDLSPGPVTSYFRTQFTSDGSATALTAEVMYDDGFVAYLNGHEVARRSMPAGAVGATTAAASHEADGRYEAFSWNDALPYLIQGENTLAVEVHQSSTTSSDLVFDLALHVEGAWHPQSSGTTASLHDVTFLDHERGWVVGDGGVLLRTTDGGVVWQAQSIGTSANLRGLQLTDASHGWIVGDAGTVLATSDAGATWAARSPGISADIAALSFVDATTGWIVAGASAYHTTDGGLTWTAQPIATGGTFYGIGFADALHGWAVGMVPAPGDSWAAIYATADGGATWTQQWLSGLHFAYLWGVEVVDAQTIWAFGQDSLSSQGERKMVSRDGGATWAYAATGSNDVGVYDIEFLDADHAWAVGFGGTIVYSGDRGLTWTTEQAWSQQRPNLDAVDMVDAQEGWAVGDSGLILHTENGGH